ncbi:MAG: hypothetical protein KDK45_24895 [Leptospiraceae bacterium]|nr:hypothetical protein [Leptospiraceae bacterium]
MNLDLNSKSFKDQFDKSYTISKDLKYILFISSMEASKKVHAYLEKKGFDTIEKKSGILISDISGMPSIITFLFARPKMKQFKYRIFLIENKEEASIFPAKKEALNLFLLESGRVVSHEILTEMSELEQNLSLSIGDKK